MAYRFKNDGWGLGALATPPANVAAALQAASTQYGIPVSLLTAVAQQESGPGFNASAVSSKGAQGVMQLMPATGASLGVTNPFDVTQNVNAGASYLSSLYKQYGDWNTALIAYNEGPGNLAKSGPFASSQSYADSILANAGMDDSSLPQNVSVSTPADASQGASTDLASGSVFDLSTDGSGNPLSVQTVSPWLWVGLAAVVGVGLWTMA